jgi:hypothetical protein
MIAAWGLRETTARTSTLFGETNSLNFPTVNAAQLLSRGNGDSFAVKLNTSGNVLLYSTTLGGGLRRWPTP